MAHRRPLAIGGLLLGSLGYGVGAGACGARSELVVPDPCAGQSAVQAELTPLDMVIMMDNSGSMAFSTSSGLSRRRAVTSAFSDFFAQPEAAGISVSLSYFPIVDESVPEACEDDAICGLAGACQPFRACLPSGGGACRDDADCDAAGFPGDACRQLGFCGDRTTTCTLGSGTCADGPCLSLGHCDNRYTCDAAGYDTPVVAMRELPHGADAVLGELSRLDPSGSTPTLPALGGALLQARRHAGKNPDHNAIVVLASDGLPTACDPEIQSGDPAVAIANLVQVAADGLAAGVRTFVIGLATPSDGGARDDLDAIAEGGGTGRALIVSAEIVDELRAALTSVRLDAGACTFNIGAGEADDDPSARVRVELPTGERPYVPWRSSAAACDSAGGFYFDPPDAPRRVVLCPATCDRFGSAIVRKIEVFTHCPG